MVVLVFVGCFFFKQKTADEMRISDWSSDVCSSDLRLALGYESCDLSRHYVPPDLLIWGSLGATLRRIRYRGGSRKSRQTTGKTEFCQDFRSANRDRPAEAKLWFRSLRGCRLTAPGGLDRKSTRLNSSH